MIECMINEINSQSLLGAVFLVAIFFYIGLITIGGGQVAITVMQQLIVERFEFLTDEKFYNMVAISESTPGPIGINIATYIGVEKYGIFGGFFSTLGEVLPSLIIIIIIAKFFGKFSEKKVVQAAFSTLRPAVSGVIAVAAAKVIVLALVVVNREIFKIEDISTWNLGISIGFMNAVFFLACLFVLFKTKIHPVFVVLSGAVYGVFFC